jgi:hypothetical protein
MTAMQKIGTLKANMRFHSRKEKFTNWDRLVARCRAYNRAHGYIVPRKSTASIVMRGGR